MSKMFELKEDQKILIYRTIKQRGADPSRFKFVQAKSKLDPNLTITRIRYGGTPYFFDFDLNQEEDNFYNTFGPGKDLRVESRSGLSWQGQVLCFQEWLHYLNDELLALNVIKQLQQKEKFIDADSETEIPNPPFEPEEIVDWETKLEDVRKFFEERIKEERDITDEQIETMHANIDFLKEELKRAGKFSWKHTVRSLLYDTAFFIFTNPDKVHTAMNTLLAQF